MLREYGEWIRTTIGSSFKQVDYYEGQFDMLDEVVINPPSCFIGYELGEEGASEDPLGNCEIILYLATSKMERNPGNMLDLIEAVSDAVNKKPVRDESNVYLGRCFVNGWKWRGAYPGLIVYEMRLRVRK